MGNGVGVVVRRVLCSLCFRRGGGQIFGDDMEEDYELGEALRGDITDNPLDIYMRVQTKKKQKQALIHKYGTFFL